MIEINLYGPFREAVGTKTVERPVNDGDTVEAVLADLAEEYPALTDRLFEEGALRDSINVMKNGTNVNLIDGGETSVGSGDRLSVVVSLEGGCGVTQSGGLPTAPREAWQGR